MRLLFSGKRLIYIIIGVYIILLILIVYVEKNQSEASIGNIFDAFWYSIVTLCAVGYGDYYPVTLFGKILSLLLVLGSLLVLGFLIGNVTNKIMQYMEKKKFGLLGTDMKKHIIIIGWDKFGKQVIDEIIKADHKVAIITENKKDIDLITDLYSSSDVFPLFCDFNNWEALKNANIDKASIVFVNFNDDTETLVYIINLKKQFLNLEFIVSLNNADLKDTFLELGIRYALAKNEIASKLVASYIFEPDVAIFTENFMSTAIKEYDYDIQEYRIIEENPYVGKDYMDAFIDMKTSYDSVLIGISKTENNKRFLLKNPAKGIRIETNDYLIIMANGISKKKIEQAFKVKEGRLLD